MKSYIVVGAGILGASTAYHLAKSGVSVTVVDRKDAGQATDAAAGIICPWLTQRRNKAWYRLASGGAAFYPALIKELEAEGETNTGYEQVGAISLHTDESKLEKMKERALKRREDAPEIGEVVLLTPTETKSLFPALSAEYGSVYVSGGARVNGRALRDALMNAAQKHGAVFREGNGALDFEHDKVTGVMLDGEALKADAVIVTGGAWAKELFQPLGFEFMVTSQKAQIVHLDLHGTGTSKWPVVMPPNNQYLLTLEDGRIVVGATHEDEAGAEFDKRVTAGGVHEILDKALTIAPGLASATFLETRVGFRPFTPGFLPVIGPLPEYKGLFVANGLGASGLTSGPFLGAELAKLALGDSNKLNISDYDIAKAIQKSK
ncbi:NAD(P)/FAD-dependent oxidoreductase [Alteribacter populi]|uniref:NAD(P)/FAD-dependent oxidoreductase n=1 Tax=Alteribacter populi TaxID=2011011 RepID=UPI000BBAAC0F|nr:FAD-dependent oxidoreductase [Alteribacter populi]